MSEAVRQTTRPILGSLAVHAGLIALVLSTSAAVDRPADRRALALEIELSEPPPPIADATPPTEPAAARTPATPPKMPAPRPRAPRRARVHAAPPPLPRAPAEGVAAVVPAPPAPTEPPELPEPREPPPRPFAAFDTAALAAAIEAPPSREPGGTTIRGDEVDDGEADEGAVRGVQAVTAELRERAQAGRPERENKPGGAFPLRVFLWREAD